MSKSSVSFRRPATIALFFASVLVTTSSAAAASAAPQSTTRADYIKLHVFYDAAPNEIPPADAAIPAEDQGNFLDWYEDGVNSYMANDWANCVENIERALAGYRDYYTATAACRIRCRRIAETAPPLYQSDPTDRSDLRLYETLLRRSLCLVKCKQILLPDYDEFFELGAWAQEVFRSRKPYTYLQLCHYRRGDLQRAAQATYTALQRNPADRMMEKNLQFYVEKLPAVGRIEELEAPRFAEHYERGVREYAAKNWTAVVGSMERSMELWRSEWEECRAYCEGDYEQEWRADFATATANHFAYTLRCKANCTEDLGRIRGNYYENLYASHYEYLHISYYNANQTQKACSAAASYLEIAPTSTAMQDNMRFYLSRKLNLFCHARPESKSYAAQQSYEQLLLNFIAREFSDQRVKIPAGKLQAIMRNAVAAEKALRQT